MSAYTYIRDSLGTGNLRDQVVPVLVLLQSAESHLCARDVLLGVLKVFELADMLVLCSREECYRQLVTYQSVVAPGDSLLLVGISVCEALDRASLAAEQAMQVGANLVGLSIAEGVALSAPGLEEVGTLLAVTCVGNIISPDSSKCFRLSELGPECTCYRSAAEA